MDNIAVIGSGTMGSGIAQVFAQHGFQVSLVDLNQETINRGLATIRKSLERQVHKKLITDNGKQETLSKITTFTQLKEGIMQADLIIEAATENLNTKLNIFKELDRFSKPDALLTSNTSSISITKIASVTKRPGKVVGMHFMNPVPVMKLVEVIKGYSTDDETLSQVIKLTEQIDKVPVQVNDYPGFISNRILMPMINEAIYAYYEGVAAIEDIDKIMQFGMAHPMGPLKLADFIGLDVCLAILQVLHEGFGNPKYAPCPLLVNLVNANKLGKKTGEGFYKY